MLVFGGVAAEHFAATLADTEVNPAIIHANAFFTTENRVVCFRDKGFWRYGLEVFAGHGIGKNSGLDGMELEIAVFNAALQSYHYSPVKKAMALTELLGAQTK